MDLREPLAAVLVLCYSHIMASEATRWLEQLPAESFFRTADVPGRSRSSVRNLLSREASREIPLLVMKVGPNLYWKPGSPSVFTGEVFQPSWTLIGWEVAGPHAGALGWYGANLVGWSNQLARQRLEFAVPGEPRHRHPHPRVTIRGRRNLTRRKLTRLEATYLEAVISFDRWSGEVGWDKALRVTASLLEERADYGEELPRAEVLAEVAGHEHPKGNRDLFRSRIAELVTVMGKHQQD